LAEHRKCAQNTTGRGGFSLRGPLPKTQKKPQGVEPAPGFELFMSISS
jgi:hypothetical protein